MHPVLGNVRRERPHETIMLLRQRKDTIRRNDSLYEVRANVL
jgi:hypothetical protein